MTFEGRFERVHDAVVLPMPTAAPPLMIGSIGDRVLRATLPHVDAWNIWYDLYGNSPEGFARENARVSRLLLEAGRDPSEVVRAILVVSPITEAAIRELGDTLARLPG